VPVYKKLKEIYIMKIEININISDKLVAFIKRIFTVRNGVFATVAILFGIGALLFADQITKPHTFKGGDIISASQINKNFDDLYSKVNDLEPSNDPVETALANGSVYHNTTKHKLLVVAWKPNNSTSISGSIGKTNPPANMVTYATGYEPCSVTFIVPVGYWYSVSVSDGSPSAQAWEM
jgi:hypothetical protein